MTDQNDKEFDSEQAEFERKLGKVAVAGSIVACLLAASAVLWTGIENPDAGRSMIILFFLMVLMGVFGWVIRRTVGAIFSFDTGLHFSELNEDATKEKIDTAVKMESIIMPFADFMIGIVAFLLGAFFIHIGGEVVANPRHIFVYIRNILIICGVVAVLGGVVYFIYRIIPDDWAESKF